MGGFSSCYSSHDSYFGSARSFDFSLAPGSYYGYGDFSNFLKEYPIHRANVPLAQTVLPIRVVHHKARSVMNGKRGIPQKDGRGS